MSARDSESGSSSYKGGSGRAGGLGNGGIGGGMGGGGNYGGGMGGGAGRNGGIGNQTGMQTGNTWRGTSAYGRPGGPAMGYGMSPMAARQAAFQGIMGRLRQGPPQQGVPVPVAAPPPAAVPPPQRIIGYLPGWPGTGMWWGNQPPYQNNEGLMTHQTPPQGLAPGQPKYQDRVPSGVGPGGWPGQANGPHWSSNGTYSGYDGPQAGYSGGGRGGGGGGGW